MLTFKTIKDGAECRKLWEIFSTKEVLWDLWDFRYCFHNNHFRFNFILGLEGKKQVGILPLVYDKENDTYAYFWGYVSRAEQVFSER